jgi:hypothetical protein
VTLKISTTENSSSSKINILIGQNKFKSLTSFYQLSNINNGFWLKLIVMGT